MIRALPSLCLVFLFACGTFAELQGGGDPEPLEPVAESEPVVEQRAERPVPADFTIAQSGGPVARWMAAGMTLTRSHVEARPGAPGQFDFVTIEVEIEPSGMDGEPREVSRVPVDRAELQALYSVIVDRRAELERPCFNPNIMDGATSGFRVHMEGADHTFSCTNASSPAFDALGAAYRQLVSSTAS